MEEILKGSLGKDLRRHAASCVAADAQKNCLEEAKTVSRMLV